MKLISRITALIITLAILLSFTACKELGAIKNLADIASNAEAVAEDWQKYEEAISKLTNYKIVIESVDEYDNKSVMTEMRCDDGYAIITDGGITFVDFAQNKMYILSPDDKSGWVYDNADADAYKGFGLAMYGYLYTFEAFKLLGAKKDGSDKISGRKTTVYTYSADGSDWKFWTDDEYGLTMKYEKKSSGDSAYMEVTEFKTSGVKLSDMVNLGEYEIQDLSDFGNFGDFGD